MNRAALYVGVVICFVMVTAASFFFGKVVLGEKLLNKQSPETRHRPGDQPEEKSKDTSDDNPKPLVRGDAFSTTPRDSTKSAPRVIIEVKPGAPRPTENTTTEAPETKKLGARKEKPHLSTEAPTDETKPAKKPYATTVTTFGDGQTAVTPTPKRAKRRPVPEHLPPPAVDDANGDPLPAVKPAPDPTSHDMNATVKANRPAKQKVGAVESARSPGHGVQVGLFSARENADARAAELQKRGYPVVTVSEERDGQRIYRVQVGPFKNKDTAAKIKKELSDQGFEGFVPQ